MPSPAGQTVAPRLRRAQVVIAAESRDDAIAGGPGPEAFASELRALLMDMRAGQERLLAAVRLHRDAISRADQKDIAAGLEAHRVAIEEIRALEERRAHLGRRLAGRGSPGAGVTLGQMLSQVPAGVRDALAALGAEVKHLALTAQLEQRALGEASLALAGHIEGLMRGVSSRVSEAGVYGRRGYVESGARPVGVLDVSR